VLQLMAHMFETCWQHSSGTLVLVMLITMTETSGKC